MVKLYPSAAQLLLVVCCYINLIEGDHYWRDYTGVIPYDAFVAGKQINDKNIYVGQAYVKDWGIIVGQISKGVKEIALPIHGVVKTSLGIKILCSKFDNPFTWMVANSTLGTILLNKQPVVGGLQSGHLLYIGRVFAHGEIKVGKVTSSNPDDSRIHYVEGDKEINVKNYEVLMINENLS